MRLLGPWDLPGKNTGVGCHFLLQGIFPTRGSNPGLPHYRQTLYHLSRQGTPLTIDDSHQTIKPLAVFTFGIAFKGFPGGAGGKNLPASAGDARDAGLIPGWKDSLRKA